MPNLKFRDVIAIYSINANKFLAVEKDGTVNANRAQALQWEKFLILNPNNIQSNDEIKSGDEVSLLSYHNNYLVCESNGEIKANRENLGPWEKFTIYKFNSTSTGQSFGINGNGDWTPFALRSHTGHFLTTTSQNKIEASLSQIDTSPMNYYSHGTAFVGYVKEWTDFHYGVSIGDPQCPKRGRFDGANCFVARPPEGSPFIYHNNFYYSTSNNDPILGWFDGSNAQVGQNDINDEPFIYNNAFYLEELNSYLTANEVYTLTPSVGAIKVCVNKALYYGSLAVPVDVSKIQYIKVCYKKYWAQYFRRPCFQSETFNNSRCGMITNLSSGTWYKIKVFLKYTDEPYEIDLGTRTIKPQ